MDEKEVKSVEIVAQTVQKTFEPTIPETPEELSKYLEETSADVKKLRMAERKILWLRNYQKSWGKMYFACQQAGVTYTTARRWRDNDPDFKAAVEHLNGLFADQIEGIIDKKIISDHEDRWIERRLAVLAPGRYPAAAALTGSLTIHLDEDNDDVNAHGENASGTNKGPV